MATRITEPLRRLLGDRKLGRYVRENLLPSDCEYRDQYVPSRVIGRASYSFQEEEQIARLRSWRQGRYPSLFAHLRAHPEINPGIDGRTFGDRNLIHNGFFPSPDAEIYSAMLLDHRPSEIIEIGSGFSTLVAREAISFDRLDTRLKVIDPQPRRSVEGWADEIVYKRAENSRLESHAFRSDSLLFIDSSHICRSLSDVTFLYCNLLPNLPAGVLIHIHDVFLPYDYPDNYFERFYSEQYLLHCLLSDSNKFRVRLATHFLAREYASEMQATFGPEIGVDQLFFGASFWIQSIK